MANKMQPCGQLFPKSLSSAMSGCVGLSSLTSSSAVVGYADGNLGFFSVSEGEVLSPVELEGSRGLSGMGCFSACVVQAESLEHFVGVFAGEGWPSREASGAGPAAQGRALTLGRLMVQPDGEGGLKPTMEVKVSIPVDSAEKAGLHSGRTTCLHVNKHQLVYGTAEGIVTVHQLVEARKVKQFYLAKGSSSPACMGRGPYCHAVLTNHAVSEDIVLAAG